MIKSFVSRRAALVLGLAWLSMPAARAHDACDDIGVVTCPSQASGALHEFRVLVNDDFNTRPPFDTLDAVEIQCAVDCLDGDPDADHHFTTISTEPWCDSALPNISLTGTALSEGGVIEFLGRPVREELSGPVPIRYELDGPLLLPFATRRPVVIRGNGAVLEFDPDTPSWAGASERAAISRILPDGMSNYDIVNLSGRTQLWSIEDLEVRSLAAPTRSRPPYLLGIDLTGTQLLQVRRCELHGSLDVGIRLRSALHAVIEGCSFSGCQCSDIWLAGAGAKFAGGAGCLESENLVPAWDGGASNRTSGGCEAVDTSGSNGSMVLNTHHRGSQASQQRTIFIGGSDRVVVDGAVIEGERPLHAMSRVHSTTYEAWLENTHFSVPASTESPLIANLAQGNLHVDGITLAETEGASLVLKQHLAVGPQQHASMSNSMLGDDHVLEDPAPADESSGFSFFDCPADLGPDDPGRWLDVTPPHVVVTEPTRAVLADWFPQGSAINERQLRLHAAHNAGLWYCCDASGALVKIEGVPR